MEVDKKIYNEIAAEIQSDDSPVGIDAKKTHIIILDKLIKIEAKLTALQKDVDQLKLRS